MRYLVKIKDEEPFLTEWFDMENNFNKEVEMIVYDLHYFKYTSDGITWQDIDIDNL